MWDLDSIIRNNNQAAINYMMRGRAVDVVQSPQPEAWSLTLLAEKLRVGPPMLAYLLDAFTNFDTLESFLRLIRNVLPEHEEEILSENGVRRVYRFCYLFGKKYYPLPTYTFNANVSQLVAGMPVEFMAMSYSAYHELNMRPGYLLLLALVPYPYEGDERDLEDDDVPFDPFDPMGRLAMGEKLIEIAEKPDKKSEWKPTRADIAWVKDLISTLSDGGKWFAPMGFTVIKVDDRNIELVHADNTLEVRETVRRTVLIAEKAGIKVKVSVGKTAEEKQGATLMEIFSGARVPLLDAVQHIVGEDMAGRIPKDGWEPSELHQMTDGTPHDGVGHFADWACSDTGCVILDTSYDDVGYSEGDSEPIFRWSKFNIDILTKQEPKVKEIRQKIDNMADWLEADLIGHFGELLEFLMMVKAKSKRKKAAKVKRGAGYDPTEHWCALDQVFYEEDECFDEDDDDPQLRELTRGDISAATRF